MIILPRQARDKHVEKLRSRRRFLAGVFWDMDSFMTRPVALAAPGAGVALGRFR
jgi:hypothetical protein